MTSEPHDVLHLPLGRGSYDYMSLQMGHVKHQGWYVRFWHRHAGEKELCGPFASYDGLTLDEAVDLVQSLICVADDRFETAPDGQCRPSP